MTFYVHVHMILVGMAFELTYFVCWYLKKTDKLNI